MLFRKMSKCSLILGSLMLASMIQTVGCVDLTMQRSQLSSSPKHVVHKKHHAKGQVYTMRGFLGIFSRGMDQLAVRCNDEVNVQTMSIAAPEWRQLAKHIIAQKHHNELNGPLILVGHSEGADNQIDVAYALQKENIPVDLLVLIGPFAPSSIPTNVKQVYNLDRSYAIGHVLPFMGNVSVRVADSHKTAMETLDIGYTKTKFDASAINHFNIDKSQDVQNLVLDKIRELVGKSPDDVDEIKFKKNMG